MPVGTKKTEYTEQKNGIYRTATLLLYVFLIIYIDEFCVLACASDVCMTFSVRLSTRVSSYACALASIFVLYTTTKSERKQQMKI
jgi:hypothetical protein